MNAEIKNKRSDFFEGLTIIELASVLAGPATGMFFSELGARVIKIENALTGGDITRQWKLPSESPASPLSAYYCSVNFNKEILFFDLNSEADKSKLYPLVQNADIIISNYKTGDAEKLGMDYSSLKKVNSKIIYAHIGGFPQGINRVAFDVVLQAETGFISMNGTPESGPVKMPVALIDILAAHQLKEVLLLALLNREKTGSGSYVSTTLYEAAIASLANQASNFLMNNVISEPQGSLHPNIAPYGETFKTKDNRSIILAIGNNKQFNKLCETLHLSLDEKFNTNTGRIKNRKELFELFEPAFRKYNAEDLIHNFEKNKIPAGLIKNLEEVFKDPEAKAMVLEENIQGYTTKRVKSTAFSASFL